jgi:hypothetical protein|nr:MAG TPA: hypothetical protein [Caudoviricetes sp.]
MINYFEDKKDCVKVKYYDTSLFGVLNALNIPYQTDDSNNLITIPKLKRQDFKKKEDTSEEQDSSVNNGGSTSYYKIGEYKDLQDIIENRNMNFAQGNILKAAFCFNVGRHEGTSYERELNKIIYFANRELQRIKNNG